MALFLSKAKLRSGSIETDPSNRPVIRMQRQGGRRGCPVCVCSDSRHRCVLSESQSRRCGRTLGWSGYYAYADEQPAPAPPIPFLAAGPVEYMGRTLEVKP